MFCPDSHIIYLTCLQSMYFRLNCTIFYSFAIIYKKGYQDFDNVQSVVTTKVKGIAMVNTTVHPNIQPIWDVADYIVPPQVSDCLLQPEVLTIITHQGLVINRTSLLSSLQNLLSRNQACRFSWHKFVITTTTNKSNFFN